MMNIRMYLPKVSVIQCILAFFVSSAVLCMSPFHAHGETNPKLSGVTVYSYPGWPQREEDSDDVKYRSYYIGFILWEPSLEPWNGRTTDAGNRYKNIQISEDFTLNVCGVALMPCPDDWKKSVKEEECRDYWNRRKLLYGYDLLWFATTAGNCHAIATGKAYPDDGPDGIGKILADDWEQATISDLGEHHGIPGSCNYSYTPGGATIAIYGSGKTHAVKITGKCGPNNEYVTGIMEKFGTGPIYTKSVPCGHPNPIWGAYVYYRKKTSN